jgi:hypothetical protein
MMCLYLIGGCKSGILQPILIEGSLNILRTRVTLKSRFVKVFYKLICRKLLFLFKITIRYVGLVHGLSHIFLFFKIIIRYSGFVWNL